MTDNFLERTFFPSARKEVIVESITLLQNRAGENRIKLGLVMPLSDGKLVGLPTWIGDTYDHMGKVDTLELSTKYTHDLSEMTLYVHTGEDTVKPAQTLMATLLTNFCLQRDVPDEKKEEAPEVRLHFAAYISASQEAWSWLYRHFRQSIYILFLATQSDIEDPKSTDPQMKLVPEKDSSDDEEFEHQVVGRVRRAVTQ